MHLRNPLFEQLPKEKRFDVLSVVGKSDKYRVNLADWDENKLYVDPLSRHPSGSAFASRLVAAKRDVTLPGRVREDTGLAVIIQENYDHAVDSVQQLGVSLARLGMMALAGLLAIVTVLWLLVVRALSDPNEHARKHGGRKSVAASLHSMETIELPTKLKR